MKLHQGLLLAAILVMCAAPIQSQLPPDTAAINNEARAAARAEPIAHYGIAAFVAVPMTIVSTVALMTGGEPKPVMIIGPAGVIALEKGANRSATARLSPPLETRLQSMDSVSAMTFRQTYNKTLSRRRRSAVGIGGLIGTLTSIALLALAFAGYGGD